MASLEFAQGTPYETRLAYQPAPAERLLQPEIANVVRRGLIGVVENGTAKRLKGSLVRRDGSVVEIGGKTGTVAIVLTPTDAAASSSHRAS